MGYGFQVVPLRDFEQHRQRLQRLPAAIDRPSALVAAAGALLLQDAAERCLAGVADEKRHLAIWVRQGRIGVRLIRGQGSSNQRAWAQAALSNAADQARNRLDQLQLEAPRALDQARQQLRLTARYVSLDEARAFIPAYLDGVRAAERANTTQGLCLLLLLAGGLALFLAWPLGLALLALAGLLFLGCRGSWLAVARAEGQRQRQHGDAQADAAEGRSFLERLALAASARDPELDQAAVAAIAADLRREHVFLEVACRELGSRALTWEQLAAEIMPAQQLSGEDPPPLSAAAPGAPSQGQSVGGAPIGGASASAALAAPDAAPGPASADSPAIAVRHERGDLVFSLDLAGAQAILRRLGYRRLPRSWPTISARAQQRLCTDLAASQSLRAEDFRWSFEEGLVRATPGSGSADL